MTSSQPVKKLASKIDYTRLPWIAGLSRNHMIRNCPTTSQETFNDGYNWDNLCMSDIKRHIQA